jgi:hypothetical protein
MVDLGGFGMDDYKIYGQVAAAPFTLTLHRGEGMCLLAMNWRNNQPPPDDFVGFMIEYREPKAENDPSPDKWWTLNNRLSFTDASKITDKSALSTRSSPIQKFRWVHFPFAAALEGLYSYRVTPVFMSPSDELSYGTAQTADVALQRETYPGKLDIGFTRGFIASQAFVDNFGSSSGSVDALIPPGATKGTAGLEFPLTAKADEAYAWMGFEARKAILGLLDAAIADPNPADCKVRLVAYDFDLAEVYDRVLQLAGRIQVIIDDSDAHGESDSAESTAETLLRKALGDDNVIREHCGGLQHNKFIVVTGSVNKAVCGSTNFSWRGFYVQNNNAVTISGADAIAPFVAAFDAYWGTDNSAAKFIAEKLGGWRELPLQLPGGSAQLCFSPHGADTARLAELAADINATTSSLLYSLAFLYQTPGPILDSISAVTKDSGRFVYGISDRRISRGGLDVTLPDGNTEPVYASSLGKNVPSPFKEEPTGGSGVRMHHKFVVIDFDKPSARVYFGSYNFSHAADVDNGENLMVIRDRVATTAFMVEALCLFDHYHFRVVAGTATNPAALVLAKPPQAGEKPWFDPDYTVEYKIHDRELFSA